MDLTDLTRMCNDIFGARGGDGSQEATGAVGHIKGYPINGNGEKTLFVARQGGPFAGPVTTKKYGLQTVNLTWNGNLIAQVQQFGPVSAKDRAVDDCREGLVTKRKKSEWTGYHAEMIVVGRWIKLAFPAITKDNLSPQNVATIRQAIRNTVGAMIVANAPCCKHCHNMLTYLNVAHPAPAMDMLGQPVLKASLTAWWNPLTDACVPQGDADFGSDIPGL